jgi:ribosomal protein S18 acetylase RimI-like enzyme
MVNLAHSASFHACWKTAPSNPGIKQLVITLGYSIEYGERDGFIDDFYLVPELRGRGVGRRLLAFALDRARELGIEMLHLEVEQGNGTAQGLYRARGSRKPAVA